MSYKIYTDKNEDFECEVAVKNASLKGSIARLIVESSDANLVFNGKIEGEKCIIPIKRLKGLLDENVRGKMHLELIVEDTYFKPWESDFVVEEHTSVKVKVNESKQTSNKPIVEVKSLPTLKFGKPVVTNKKRSINIYVPLKEISDLCERFDINTHNFRNKKDDFSQLVKEYFNANTEYKNHAAPILKRIRTFLK